MPSLNHHQQTELIEEVAKASWNFRSALLPWDKAPEAVRKIGRDVAKVAIKAYEDYHAAIKQPSE